MTYNVFSGTLNPTQPSTFIFTCISVLRLSEAYENIAKRLTCSVEMTAGIRLAALFKDDMQ